MPMESRFTAVYRKEGKWWVAFVEELPGANSQGRSLESARKNLKEAVSLIIEANRELAKILPARSPLPLRERIKVRGSPSPLRLRSGQALTLSRRGRGDGDRFSVKYLTYFLAHSLYNGI